MQLNHQKRGGLVRQCYFAAQQVEAERIKHHLTRTQNGAVNAGTARGQEKSTSTVAVVPKVFTKTYRKHRSELSGERHPRPNPGPLHVARRSLLLPVSVTAPLLVEVLAQNAKRKPQEHNFSRTGSVGPATPINMLPWPRRSECRQVLHLETSLAKS